MSRSSSGQNGGGQGSSPTRGGGLGPDRTDPEVYWERRLGKDFSLKGVGYRALGRPFNEWAYCVRRSALRRTLKIHRVCPDRSDLLEVGFGTGYFVKFWTTLGARSVTGIDLTQRAVEEATARYPQHRFFRQDISDPACPAFGAFDIVTVFDVLFHVLDDRAFERAVVNVCRQVRVGGLLLLTDILSGTETLEGPTQRSRPLPAYRRLLESCGMRIVGLHPVFFSMSMAPDLSMPWARRLSSTYWGLICTLMEKTPLAGHVVGPVGYVLDGMLQRLATRGPSVKLLVARRET